MEVWAVICVIFLGDEANNPETFEIFWLIEETEGVSLHLHTQAQQQPAFPATLMRLIQTEFNERFFMQCRGDRGFNGRTLKVCDGHSQQGTSILNS